MVYRNVAPLLDLPMWEQVAAAPVITASVTWMCNDQRGTGQYLYYCGSLTDFWRYDTWSNAWQQLANPVIAGTQSGGSNAGIYDPTYGTGGGIWAYFGTGTGPSSFSVYDVALNTWTTRATPTLYSGLDVAIVHTCSSYYAGGNDNFIYTVGSSGSNAIARYSISGNSWTTFSSQAWLSGPAGNQLLWLPAVDPDKLLYIKGAGSLVWYAYSISGNTSATYPYLPALGETLNSGTYTCPRSQPASKFWVQNSTLMRFFEFDATTTWLNPRQSQRIIATGAAVGGNRMCYVVDSSGTEWIYMILHNTNEMLRTIIT